MVNKIHPLELLEHLAFSISPFFNGIRLKGCNYDEGINKLEAIFAYSDELSSEIDALKNHLESEFIKNVKAHTDENFSFEFLYEKNYIDDVLLKLYVIKHLKTSFVLAMDVSDDDVEVKRVEGGFRIDLTLSKQNANYVKDGRVLDNYIDSLRKEYFDEFSVKIIEKEGSANICEESFIDKFIAENTVEESARVNKAMKIKGLEYYLGKPIKERPIYVEFLKVSGDDQVIAGVIVNFTRREFTAKPKEGEEVVEGGEKKPFFTFMLDDGKNKASCVHFPNAKTLAKFEKLVDGTVVCLIGQNTERNGRVGFRVNGVSWCDLAY